MFPGFISVKNENFKGNTTKETTLFKESFLVSHTLLPSETIK